MGRGPTKCDVWDVFAAHVYVYERQALQPMSRGVSFLVYTSYLEQITSLSTRRTSLSR